MKSSIFSPFDKCIYFIIFFLTGIPFVMETSETEFGDSGKINFRDLPVFYVVTNFVISNITALNAPIRQIPMTHKSHQPIPLLGKVSSLYCHVSMKHYVAAFTRWRFFPYLILHYSTQFMCIEALCIDMQ